MAATVVTNDPTFGWLAYGGTLTDGGATLAINPRDGLRRRLAIVLQDLGLPFADSLVRLKMELERDGFDKAQDLVIDKTLGAITFRLENRTGDAHATGLRLALPANARYTLTVGGTAVPLQATDQPDYPWRAEIPLGPAGASVQLSRIK